MKYSVFSVAAAGLLFASAACSGGSGNENASTVIDVAGAVENPTNLKVSQLGSKITYVPLETTDSSLIPQSWRLISVPSGFLVVNYSPLGIGQQNCLSFDSTGKFIGAIGHAGEDAEAYSTPFPLLSTDYKTLYFARWGTNRYLQKYDLSGTYLGKAYPSIPPLCASNSTQIVDSTIVSPYGVFQDGQLYLTVYSGNFNGVVDTLAINPLPEGGVKYSYFENAMIGNYPGVMQNSIVSYRIVSEMGGDRRTEYNAEYDNNRFWRVGDKLHFRQPFFDTIYTITPRAVEIAYTFDCGKDALKPAEINSSGIKDNSLWVTEMCETKDKIIFGASIGWLGTETHKPFVGYFDKKSGKTFAGDAGEGFVDDLTGFMPFYPIIATPGGDLIGVVTADQIFEWIEKHPDVKVPEVIQNLDIDANPVCVIVSR